MSRWSVVVALLVAVAIGVAGWRWYTAPIKASDITTVSEPKAQKALVTTEDVPSGWRTSPADEDDDEKVVYDPAACATLGQKPPASSRMATVSYERGGTFAAAMVETIYRPEGRTPAQEVAQLRSLAGQCASYRYRKGANKGFTVSVTQLEVTKQATDTLGIRSSISGTLSAVSDSIIWVAAGDAVVRFDSITAGDGMTQKDLEKLVKTSLKRLKK